MPGSADWTVRTADAIDGVVDLLRDRAVVPVTSVARWIVYGLLAAIAGLMALVLVAIALVRVLVVYVPPNEAWLAHLIVGGIFALSGLFLWAKRRSRPSS